MITFAQNVGQTHDRNIAKAQPLPVPMGREMLVQHSNISVGGLNSYPRIAKGAHRAPFSMPELETQ